MRKLSIAIDLDETINTLVHSLLPLYNAKYSDNVQFEDLTDYNTHRFLKPECKNVFAEFVDDDFLLSLSTQDGSVECVKRLMERHNVYFLTAGHIITGVARDKWLKALFPLYDSSKLIMCKDKSLIHMDILIDDCPHNLSDSYNYCLLLEQPWNKSTLLSGFEKPKIRCRDWQCIEEVISLLEYE